jgi:hypothetical protein
MSLSVDLEGTGISLQGVPRGPLAWRGDIESAKRPERLRAVLTREEAEGVLTQIERYSVPGDDRRATPGA